MLLMILPKSRRGRIGLLVIVAVSLAVVLAREQGLLRRPIPDAARSVSYSRSAHGYRILVAELKEGATEKEARRWASAILEGSARWTYVFLYPHSTPDIPMISSAPDIYKARSWIEEGPRVRYAWSKTAWFSSNWSDCADPSKAETPCPQLEESPP